MTQARFLKTTMARTLFMLDAALVVIVWPLVHWFFGSDIAGGVTLLAYPLGHLLLFHAMGLYRREAFVEKRKAVMRVPLIAVMGATAAVTVRALAAAVMPGISPLPVPHDEAVIFGIAILCFSLCGVAARGMLALMLRRNLLHRRLLVVGAGPRAWDLLRMLRKEGTSLNYDITFLRDPPDGSVDPGLEAEPNVAILPPGQISVLNAARAAGADQIVIAPDERRGMDLEQLLACKKAGFPVVQYLSFVEQEIKRVDIKRMDLGWLVFSDGFYFGAIDRFLKRVFDIVVSLSVLILAMPLILLGIAAIRLEGKGPVFYRQERVTLDGTVFRILKLRTMRVDAEAAGAVWAAERDNRITRAGLFLRRARIDELPQLINILKGEMSFVGPRPERPMFVKELAEKIPLYQERHMVKAGLTGWAQVNYPYGASVDDARSKLSYDLYYVKNFSIFFDFMILMQTLRVVLWPGGVR